MKMRIRMNHDRTQKDGWVMKDDTVEIEFDTTEVDPTEVDEALAGWKQSLYQVGVQIANERNRREGRI